MKFFRQRSSASTSSDHQKRLSISGAVNGMSNASKINVDSISEIVKKLRHALNKSANFSNNNNDGQNYNSNSGGGNGGDKNPNQTTGTPMIATNASLTSHHNHVGQCLESLRQTVILIYFHNISHNERQNNDENNDKNNTKNCNSNENSENALQTIAAATTPTKGNNNNNNNSKLIETLTEELYSSDIILELIEKLPQIGFENRKLCASIVSNALLWERDGKHLTVEYIRKEPAILMALVGTYRHGSSDLTLFTGRILRQCLQYECLAAIVINSLAFNEFFSYVNQRTFDVAMDAFLTLRILLTTHTSVTDDYITQNRVHFFHNYIQLIHSDNYVTKRQSLEILALILSQSVIICRQFCVHSAYMTVVLKLFWHKYRHIRFRALNVFNVLINIDSQLSTGVMDFLLLQTNRHNLLEVLNNFRNCKTKCKYFLALKPFAIKLIQFFNETADNEMKMRGAIG